MSTRNKFYVGLRVDNDKYEVFSSKSEPIQSTHGDIYKFSLGHFRTKRDAQAFIDGTFYLSPLMEYYPTTRYSELLTR